MFAANNRTVCPVKLSCASSRKSTSGKCQAGRVAGNKCSRATERSGSQISSHGDVSDAHRRVAWRWPHRGTTLSSGRVAHGTSQGTHDSAGGRRAVRGWLGSWQSYRDGCLPGTEVHQWSNAMSTSALYSTSQTLREAVRDTGKKIVDAIEQPIELVEYITLPDFGLRLIPWSQPR